MNKSIKCFHIPIGRAVPYSAQLTVRRSIFEPEKWITVLSDKSVFVSHFVVTCKFVGKICRKNQTSMRNAISCYSANFPFTCLYQSGYGPLWSMLILRQILQWYPYPLLLQRERNLVTTDASHFCKFRKIESLEKIVAMCNGAYILRILYGREEALNLPAAMNNYSAIHCSIT